MSLQKIQYKLCYVFLALKHNLYISILQRQTHENNEQCGCMTGTTNVAFH